MSKHKKQKVKVSFIGMSCESVTGSSYLIEYKKEKILVECGMYQCKDKYRQYQINSRNLEFKAKELTGVILLHQHL